MSTRRNAVIMYGYSIPVDFERAEQITAKGVLDVLADGMCGEYILVGKTLINVGFDDYDSDNATEGPINLALSIADRQRVKKELKVEFPDRTDLPQLLYVTHWT